ncbi:hypothetical protein EDD21DRAFT_350793 [Dissophora ornata]|nr:hypothetical protein EDD21DRAFT_350793 [Dissophora ornata]
MKDCVEVDTDVLMEDSGLVVHTFVKMEDIAVVDSNVKREPPLRGEGEGLFRYYQERETMQLQLDTFYNGNNNRFKKHKWDAQRARNSEFNAIMNRILKLVGGSIGCRRKEE